MASDASAADLKVAASLHCPPTITWEILDGPPPVTRQDFRRAQLRQFPRSGRRLEWREYLGKGRDGIVFKVTVGSEDFAIKIFWQTTPPKPEPLPLGNGFRTPEWPFEDESRTVALLEKIRWAMDCAKEDPGQIIKIKKGPQSYNDAVANLDAFAEESRRSSSALSRTDLSSPPPFPSLPKCYGWTRIQYDEIPQLDPPVRDFDSRFDWHWALVYEYVPKASQDLKVGQAHLDFFFEVGFALEAYKQDNWHGGRLVDLNDICSPFSIGWRRTGVRYRVSENWFRTSLLDAYEPSRRLILR